VTDSYFVACFTVAHWRAERRNFKWDCGRMNEKLTRETTANTIGPLARILHPSLLRRYAVSAAKQLPTIRRRILRPSSGVISQRRVVAQAQMEALRSFEKSVTICQSIRRHVQVILTFWLNYFYNYLISIIYITDMLPQYPVNIMELFCECF